MHLSALHIYPVKSLAGCAVDRAEVDALGLSGDRRFMVVEENGNFLTQRTIPRMALVHTSLDCEHLHLSATDAGSCRVARHPAAKPFAPLRRVTVWKSTGLLADDCGDEVAAWLSLFLRHACRLVRIGEKYFRPVLDPDVAGPGDLVNFADAHPFLIIGEASLSNFNAHLAEQGEEPVPMNRFRPNLVVSGASPFAEDTWTRFKINGVIFHRAGPCARCVVTTTDQDTAERGVEPLRTLARYRRDPNNPTQVNFGQNLIHETKSGQLRVGDPVVLLG